MPTLFDALDDPIAAPVRPVVAGSLADRLPPRPYQADALDGFRRHYADGTRGMLYRLATGCGKTYAAALTAEEWLYADPDRRRVIAIACERTLVKQFRDELIGFLPQFDVGLEMSDDGTVHPDYLPPITVASRQSLYLDAAQRSRLYKFDAERYDWLVICDEAQLWAYSLPSCTHICDWFWQNPASCFLGLSATPQRGDGKTLERIFGGVCCELRLGAAQADGYLVPFRQRFIQVDGVDFKNLHEVAGDFDEGELDAIVSDRQHLVELIEPLLRESGDRRTLVFCPGVESAKAVARAINAEIDERGLPHGRAESMDGATPDDIRDEITGRHKRGESQYLVVCGLCRAGYDDPGIGCVAVFRPTKSRTLAEQMKGRGVRPLRGLLNGLATADERLAAIASSAKPDCLVIDMVGVSRMPEVASTIRIYAEAEPDEVIERAEQIAEQDADVTVAEAVERAKQQIADEREKARREREERERKAAEEARRQAKLRAEVHYTARDVNGPADGGADYRPGRIGPPATDAQVRKLVSLGWSERNARGLTKKQAGGVIGRMLNAKPNEQQVRVLSRHGRPVPKNYQDAVAAIRELNRDLSHRTAAVGGAR